MTRALLVLLALAVAGPAAADDRPRVTDFTLRSLDGKRVKLSDKQGKVVLLSFWATWCVPCKQELPLLQELQERHKDELVVLTINTDDPKTASEVRRVVTERKLKLPVLLDSDGQVLSRLHPRGDLPFSAVLDREGRRAGITTGFEGDLSKVEKQIVDLIAEKAAGTASP